MVQYFTYPAGVTRLIGCLGVLCLVPPCFCAVMAGDEPLTTVAQVQPKQDQPNQVPQLDLAADESLRTIVDREAGQYLGHPTTVLLEDGKTMIAVYPKGHGRGAIIMRRSEDGGRTWSPRLPTPGNWETSLETPTIFRTIDGDGVKRLIMFSGLYPVRLAVGNEDGTRWSPLEPIGDFGGIVAMSDLVRLTDGRYMALFHDDGRFFKNEGKAGRFVVYKTLSGDGGLTWSQPETVVGLADANLCEPGAFRSPDGNQIAVLLRENSRRKNSHFILSDDEGETWSQPRELADALTGDRHQGVYTEDDRLFISFRDMGLDSPTRGDWVAWVGTYLQMLGADDPTAKRQPYRVRLMKNHCGTDCAYPGVVRLPDGEIVTTTYGHWTPQQPPYIVSLHLRLEELDRLVDQLP